MREMVALVCLAACGEVRDMPADALMDAAEGDAMVFDGPPAACGDGRLDPGETCYATPFTFTTTDVTYDGQLADMDGDGDRDLWWLIGDEYKYLPQQAGQFAGADANAPTTYATFARALDLGGDARLELVDLGDDGITTWQTSGTSATWTKTNTAPPTTQTGPARGLEVANVTGGTLPNVIALNGTNIVLGNYNQQLVLATYVTASVSTAGNALAVGKVNSDAFADIVVAFAGGIAVFRGKSGGTESVNYTAQTASTDDVAIGDIDGDGTPDLAFVVGGAAGQIGVLRGLGGGAFSTPITRAVSNLGKVIDIADVDGDGRGDVIAARIQTGTNAVLVAHGNTDATVGEPVALPIADHIDYLHADADYNGDGAPDIVATDYNFQVLTVLASKP